MHGAGAASGGTVESAMSSLGIPTRHAERAVDRVLHQQLRHDLPRLDRGGVGVVRAVDLQHAHRAHDALGHGRVDKAAEHVDVAVEHVVLRVLVRAVDALLGEHDGDLGPGHAAHVAVVVDRPADLVLDQVERAAGDSALLARDGDAADALGRALEQAVDVALAGGADDHHVVGAVPGRHAHAAQVVLEAARRDLGGHDAVGLRVDVVEVVRGRQRDAVLQALRGLAVAELVERLVGDLLAPRPAQGGAAGSLRCLRAARRCRASRWA